MVGSLGRATSIYSVRRCGFSHLREQGGETASCIARAPGRRPGSLSVPTRRCAGGASSSVGPTRTKRDDGARALVIRGTRTRCSSGATARSGTAGAVDQDGAVRAIPVQARRERRRRRSSCTRCSRAAPTCRGWCSRTRAPATARRGAPRCRASSIASTSDRITAPSLPTSPRGSARAGGGAARTRATPSGSSPPPARAPRTAARAATARPPPPTPRRGPRASRRGGRSPAPRRWPDQRRHPPSPRPRSPAILPARLYLTVPDGGVLTGLHACSCSSHMTPLSTTQGQEVAGPGCRWLGRSLASLSPRRRSLRSRAT